MANKSTLSIELKEMQKSKPSEESKSESNSYPELGKPQESQISSIRPMNPNPAISSTNTEESRRVFLPTPVYPVLSNPPPLSFIEEQRLKSEAGRNSASLANPNSVPQGFQNSSQGFQNMPVQGYSNLSANRISVPQNVFSTIVCSGCRGTIQYPISAPVVYCVQCRTSTATKPLLNLVCTFCRTTSYFIAENNFVRCRCGTVYSIKTTQVI